MTADHPGRPLINPHKPDGGGKDVDHHDSRPFDEDGIIAKRKADLVLTVNRPTGCVN